jgi:hypothetical protein
MMAIDALSNNSSPDLLGEISENPRSSPVRESHRVFKQVATPTKKIRATPALLPTGPFQLQDFYLTTPLGDNISRASPSRSVAETENHISPWRIRVRVEAEREDSPQKDWDRNIKMSVSPSKSHGRTITVPLREESASPRKGSKGKSVASRRPPTPRHNRQKKRLFDEEIDEESDVSEVTPKRRKRQDIPKRASAIRDGSNQALEDTIANGASTSRKSPAKAHNKKMIADQAERRNGRIMKTRALEEESMLSTSEGPKPLYPPIKQKHAANTRRSWKQILISDLTEPRSEFDSVMEGEDFSMVSLSTVPSAQQHLSSRPAPPPTTSAIHSRPSSSRGTENTLRNSNSHLFDLATRNSHAPRAQTEPQDARQDQSSLIQINKKKGTPSQIYSSPILPPIPLHEKQSPRALEKPSDGTPKLTRVRRAGKALQGVIDPNEAIQEEPKDQVVTPPSKSDIRQPNNLFSGFSAATRRELRAGLRLGEELARSPQPVEDPIINPIESEGDVFQEIAAASREDSFSRNPIGQDVAPSKISYPLLPSQSSQTKRQLPSPETSSNDNDEKSTPLDPSDRKGVEILTNKSLIHNNREKELEAEWQKEREAVSKQIESADIRDVLVIDTDPVDDQPDDEAPNVFGDETDIWQHEAKSSHLQDTNSSHVSLVPPRAEKEPRKLPSPWKQPKVTEADEENHCSSQQPPRMRNQQSQPSGLFTPTLTTPSPNSKPNKHNENFTNFTNFTNDMIEGQDEHFSDDDRESESPTAKAGAGIQPRPIRRPHADDFMTRSLLATSEPSYGGEISSPPITLPARSEKYDDLPLLDQTRAKRPHSGIFPTPTQLSVKSALKPRPIPVSRPPQPQYPSSAPKTQKPRTVQQIRESTEQESEPETTTQASSSFQQAGSQVSQSSILSNDSGSATTITDNTQTTWLSFLASAATPIIQSTKALTNLATAAFQASQQQTFYPTVSTQKSTPQLLTIHLPFNDTHWAQLRTIYLAAHQNPLHFPFDISSPTAEFLGLEVKSMGWKRVLHEWELAVVDEFLELLSRKGVRVDDNADDIDIEEVVIRVFSLWVGLVTRGEIELTDGKAGAWDRRFVGRRDKILKQQEKWLEEHTV